MCLKDSECREVAKIAGNPEFKFFRAAGQTDVFTVVTFESLFTKFCKLVVAVEIEQHCIFSSCFEIENAEIFRLMINNISLIRLRGFCDDGCF